MAGRADIGGFSGFMAGLLGFMPDLWGYGGAGDAQ